MSGNPGIEIQSNIIFELLAPYRSEDVDTHECTVANLCAQTDDAFSERKVINAVRFLDNQRSGVSFQGNSMSSQTKVQVTDEQRARAYRGNLLPY